MRYILIIIIFLTTTYSAPEPGISIHSTGFLTGKYPFDSDAIYNNHGALFFHFSPKVYYNKSNYAALDFEIFNPEYSSFNNFTFKPDCYINLGNYYSENKNVRWNIKSGYLPRTDVGNGLTFKDFEQIGTELKLNISDIEGTINVWGQGYSVNEDIYSFNFKYKNFPFKFSAVLWTFGDYLLSQYISSKDNYSFFILPHFKYKIWNINTYGEYGFRYHSDKKDDNAIENSNAFLIGASFLDTLFKCKIELNPEIRYYQNGFIPTTKVSSSFYEDISNYYSTTNNWIDFFNSSDNSLWLYLNFKFETPSLKGFTAFFHNELLYFKSDQETITNNIVTSDTSYTTVYKYKPSTNYYSLGIKYSFNENKFNISAKISNRLINRDPYVDGYYFYEFSQYMSRFYPTEKPFFELLIDWNFGVEFWKKK